jgi:hypothetical protein
MMTDYEFRHMLEIIESMMRKDPEFRKAVDAISLKIFSEMMEGEYERDEKYEEE